MKFQYLFIAVLIFHFIGVAPLEADIPQIIISVQLTVTAQCFRIHKRKTVQLICDRVVMQFRMIHIQKDRMRIRSDDRIILRHVFLHEILVGFQTVIIFQPDLGGIL